MFKQSTIAEFRQAKYRHQLVLESKKLYLNPATSGYRWRIPTVLCQIPSRLAGIWPERPRSSTDPIVLAGSPASLARIWPRRSTSSQLAGIRPFCAGFRRSTPLLSDCRNPCTPNIKKNIFLYYFTFIYFYVGNKI